MPLTQTIIPEWTEAHAVMDIADLVRREGSRVYGVSATCEGVYRSMLCGLTVAFRAGGAIHSISGHDLEVMVTLQETATEQDNDGIERNSPVRLLVALHYIKGCPSTLASWHKDLCAYRQSMRVSMREASVA